MQAEALELKKQKAAENNQEEEELRGSIHSEEEKTPGDGEEQKAEQVIDSAVGGAAAQVQQFDIPMWKAKIARFIAICIDGGLLQSQFTLSKMIKMIASVSDASEERILSLEIAYMLHIRRHGREYVRDSNNTLDKQLREIMNNFSAYTMNFKVLVVLIETGYC